MLKKLLQTQENFGITNGLVAWYKLNNSLVDSYGTNTLTVSAGSATYVAGVIGTAFDYNNANAVWATNESAFDFETNTPFSVSAWFKTSASGVTDIIISKSGDAIDGFLGWVIFQSSTDKIVFRYITDLAESALVTTPLAYNDNKWHHVVATYDGSGNQSGMKVYIDGVLAETGTAQAMTGSILNNHNLGVGVRGSDGTGNIWGGQLDDVRIYNRQLTANEVLLNYKIA